MERGQRRIVELRQTSTRSSGRCRAEQHLPLKVNMAGVIPAIFASSIISSRGPSRRFGGGRARSADIPRSMPSRAASARVADVTAIIFFCFLTPR
ncbi:hypothetical protein ACNKHX_20265 [Shigella flexneri]